VWHWRLTIDYICNFKLPKYTVFAILPIANFTALEYV